MTNNDELQQVLDYIENKIWMKQHSLKIKNYGYLETEGTLRSKIEAYEEVKNFIKFKFDVD